MDGLKTSLRKILYTTFKRNLTKEIKVAQLSASVSETSCYHHGEESLNKAIVGMAQNFVGSNNINLLFPSGQFGSRIKGGQDASSPRYIFTRLERITRCIFPEQDDKILTYLDDDGTQVEPQFYVPIIPMVLVNGSKGIGTGFSTEIMCYNPRDIISYLKNKLQNVTDDKIEFFPYYDGFTGETEKVSDTKFVFKGKYEKIETDRIRVTELPVGYWTEDFKELLSELQNDKDKEGKKIVPIVKDVFENYTDTTVEFVITFSKGKLQELEAGKGDHGCNGLEKLLKLYSTSSTTNMNLFNSEDKLKKYESVEEIIDDYYQIRLEYYEDRKEYMIDALEKQIMILSNKAKYIKEVLDGTIDLRKKKKQEIIDMLVDKEYDTVDDDEEFLYLVRMPMDSVSEENVEKLMKEHHEKLDELERIKATTIEQMWLSELEILENEYQEYQKEREQAQIGEIKVSKKKTITKVLTKKVIKKTAAKSELVEEEIIIQPKKKVVKKAVSSNIK
jgi:DNA topoisomerase-2